LAFRHFALRAAIFGVPGSGGHNANLARGRESGNMTLVTGPVLRLLPIVNFRLSSE
jgi:hypothetical protein